MTATPPGPCGSPTTSSWDEAGGGAAIGAGAARLGAMRRRPLLPAPLLLLGPRGVTASGLPQTWHDAARNRTLPVRLRLPRGTGPAPAVLISHGLGGSRDGLA